MPKLASEKAAFAAFFPLSLATPFPSLALLGVSGALLAPLSPATQIPFLAAFGANGMIGFPTMNGAAIAKKIRIRQETGVAIGLFRRASLAGTNISIDDLTST
jgi:hypothetical protein